MIVKYYSYFCVYQSLYFCMMMTLWMQNFRLELCFSCYAGIVRRLKRLLFVDVMHCL